jgi:hypothetical protein
MSIQCRGVKLKCGSGTERMGLKCGTERNGYGVKMRNGTDMELNAERNGYGVKMRNGTDMGLK